MVSLHFIFCSCWILLLSVAFPVLIKVIMVDIVVVVIRRGKVLNKWWLSGELSEEIKSKLHKGLQIRDAGKD